MRASRSHTIPLCVCVYRVLYTGYSYLAYHACHQCELGANETKTFLSHVLFFKLFI